MNRMSVAICRSLSDSLRLSFIPQSCFSALSILAAKISTEQTSTLGSQASYMKKLLSIVRGRMQDNVMDITMKFTLSALWNLTDESPRTCKVSFDKTDIDKTVKQLNSICHSFDRIMIDIVGINTNQVNV